MIHKLKKKNCNVILVIFNKMQYSKKILKSANVCKQEKETTYNSFMNQIVKIR